MIGDDSGMLRVYNDEQEFNLIVVASFQAHSKGITRIKQSPFNNNFIVTCSKDNTVKVWNQTNWTLIQSYTAHANQVFGIEFVNINTIATGSWDTKIYIWSMLTGFTQNTINVGVGVDSLKMLSNGYYLACGLSNGNIHIYNIYDGLVSILKGHTSYVNDLILLNNSLLASSSDDYTAKLWNTTTNTVRNTLSDHFWYVYGLIELSPSILATASRDSMIRVYNT